MPILRRVWSARYLVVDDSAPQRRLVTETLRAFGIRVIRGASGGMEALSLVCDAEPDVIVLDWFLEDTTGDRVVETIRALDLPVQPAVIVMTAYPTAAVVQAARRLGVLAVIRKPFAPDILLRSLERAAEVSEAAGRRHAPLAGAG